MFWSAASTLHLESLPCLTSLHGCGQYSCLLCAFACTADKLRQCSLSGKKDCICSILCEKVAWSFIGLVGVYNDSSQLFSLRSNQRITHHCMMSHFCKQAYLHWELTETKLLPGHYSPFQNMLVLFGSGFFSY